MLKREYKVNLKSFILWTLILVCVYIVVFAIYPSIMQENGTLEELIQTFPEELLSIFNMDIASLSHVSGWFQSEGYSLLVLLGSCYAVLFGSQILLKEENDKTIEYLLSKPVSRKKILNTKILVGITYLILFNVLISITTLIGYICSNDFSFVNWFYFSIGPIFLHIFFFLFSLCCSLYCHKTRTAFSINLGFVFGAFVLQILGQLSIYLSVLKYFSPFYYMDARQIVLNHCLPFSHFFIFFSFFLFFYGILLYFYQKKEFV